MNIPTRKRNATTSNGVMSSIPGHLPLAIRLRTLAAAIAGEP
jgi:hypothetical protein